MNENMEVAPSLNPPVAQVQFERVHELPIHEARHAQPGPPHDPKTIAKDFAGSGLDSFEETLAWVRAKSSERRRKYRKHLNGQKEKVTDKIVTESIEKGRAALADAEAHMRIFENYVNPPSLCKEGKVGHRLGVTSLTSRVVGEALRKDRDMTVLPHHEEKENSFCCHDIRATTQGMGLKTDTILSIDTDIKSPGNASAIDRLDARLNRAVGGQEEPATLVDLFPPAESSCGMPAGIFQVKAGHAKLASEPERGALRNISPEYIHLHAVGTDMSTSIPSCETHDMIEGIIHEGEKLMQQEEKIAACRRRGDEVKSIIQETTGVQGEINEAPKYIPLESKRPSPTTCVFDPGQMRGAQRSAVKAAKRAEKEAFSEAETRDKAVFKARPLPQGGWVRNDPYALTQAAIGKRVPPRDDEGDSTNEMAQHPNQKGPIRMEASVLLKKKVSDVGPNADAQIERCLTLGSKRRSQTDDGIANPKMIQSSMFNVEKLHVQEKKLIDAKKQLVLFGDSNSIEGDKNDSDDERDTSSIDDELAISELHHYITRLEAKLKRKQDLSRKTTTKIEEIDIPLLDSGSFSRGFGSSKYVLGEINKQSSGHNNNNGVQVAQNDTFLSHDPVGELLREDPFSDGTSEEGCNHESESLYRRHERWVRARQSRLSEVQLQKEDEAMKDVTGRPQLESAKESWVKAKVAHEEAARRAKEDQERRLMEREVRERQFHEQKQKEMAEIQKQAANRKRFLKSKVNKSRQKEAVNKLSRPKKKRMDERSSSEHSEGENVARLGGSPASDRANISEKDRFKMQEDPKEVLSNKGNDKLIEDPKNDGETLVHSRKGDISFADMDDKQFAKMMKVLGIKTKKENKKSNFDSCSLQKRRKDNKNNRRNMVESEKQDCGEIDLSTICEHMDNQSALEQANLVSSSVRDHDQPVLTSASEQVDKVLKLRNEGDITVGPGANASGADITMKRFTSSEAQMKLARKLESPDSYEFTVANASSALAAAETRLSPLDRKDKGGGGDIEKANCGPFHILKKEEELIRDEPYQRYETGKIPFFDRSSSTERGRFRVRDARGFRPDSMRRKPDEGRNPEDEVMLLVGMKESNNEKIGNNNGDDNIQEQEELVITILFDRSKFSERAASEWWMKHRQRFISDPADESKGMASAFIIERTGGP